MKQAPDIPNRRVIDQRRPESRSLFFTPGISNKSGHGRQEGNFETIFPGGGRCIEKGVKNFIRIDDSSLKQRERGERKNSSTNQIKLATTSVDSLIYNIIYLYIRINKIRQNDIRKEEHNSKLFEKIMLDFVPFFFEYTKYYPFIYSYI